MDFVNVRFASLEPSHCAFSCMVKRRPVKLANRGGKLNEA